MFSLAITSLITFLSVGSHQSHNPPPSLKGLSASSNPLNDSPNKTTEPMRANTSNPLPDEIARRQLLSKCSTATENVIHDDNWQESHGSEWFGNNGSIYGNTCSSSFLSENPNQMTAVTYNTLPPTLYMGFTFSKHCIMPNIQYSTIAGRDVEYLFTSTTDDLAIGFIPIHERPTDKHCLRISNRSYEPGELLNISISGLSLADKKCGETSVYGHSTNGTAFVTNNTLLRLSCSPEHGYADPGDSGGPWVLTPPTYVEHNGLIKPYYELVGITSSVAKNIKSSAAISTLEKMIAILTENNGSTGLIVDTTEPMYFYEKDNVPFQIMSDSNPSFESYETDCGNTTVDQCMTNNKFNTWQWIFLWVNMGIATVSILAYIGLRIDRCREAKAQALKDEAAAANPHPPEPANEGIVEIVVAEEKGGG